MKSQTVGRFEFVSKLTRLAILSLFAGLLTSCATYAPKQPVSAHAFLRQRNVETPDGQFILTPYEVDGVSLAQDPWSNAGKDYHVDSGRHLIKVMVQRVRILGGELPGFASGYYILESGRRYHHGLKTTKSATGELSFETWLEELGTGKRLEHLPVP